MDSNRYLLEPAQRERGSKSLLNSVNVIYPRVSFFGSHGHTLCSYVSERPLTESSSLCYSHYRLIYFSEINKSNRSVWEERYDRHPDRSQTALTRPQPECCV